MSDFESKIDINIDAGQALAAIKTLQRQISDFHTSLAKGSATANIKSLQMQQSLIDTINATGQYSAQMKTVASSTQAFSTALEKNKLSMGQYFKYAGGASKSFGKFFKTEMDTIQKVAVERVKDLQTQYIKMGRDASGALKTIAVRPLALDMENLATKTQVAAQKQQLLNQLLKQGSTNLLNFGKNTQWAGRQLMVGFTIPLGIMGTTAAKTFMQMEEQAIKFKRVYGDTFTANSETDAMVKQIQQLASEFTKYGVAVEKTMEQAATAAAAGKMGADLLAQVTESTRLSVLGNVEQQQALETTISLTNAFGTASDKLREKINFLNAVENQTVTSIEDLTTAIPKAAPVIQQLGGDVEDLTFFLTAMREGGINASESANALKSGLASLINPTKKASDFMAGFGININKIVEGNKGDVKGLVIDFAKALDTLDPLNRARAIEQLFGKFQFSRLSTLFQNVIKDGSQAARVLELTRQSSAELGILAQRELAKVSSSPMYKFQKAIADFKKELAPVGEEFLKAVTPIIQFGTDILKAFNSMDSGVKQFVINATGLIAGIGPIFLMTFGLLANGVANVIKGFTFVKNIFNKASSASTVLGETTDYMTQQQLEAASVAASLEQVHNKLTQAFTVETTAVNNLTSAYQKAVAAQTAFTGPNAVGKRGAKPKKYANGVFSVPGPKGAGDVVPAMLSPGEAVIPAKMATRYSGFISGMISGNIPGFNKGKTGGSSTTKAPIRRKSLADMIKDIGSDQPRYLTDQTMGLMHPDFATEQQIVRDAFAAQGFDIVGNERDRKSYGGYTQAHAAHIGSSRRQVTVDTKNGKLSRWIKNWAAKDITPNLGMMNKYVQDISDADIEQKSKDPKQKGKKVAVYRKFMQEDSIKRVAKALKIPVGEVRKHAKHLFAGNEALTPRQTAVLGEIAKTHQETIKVTDNMSKQTRAEVARTTAVQNVAARRLSLADSVKGFFKGRGAYKENEAKRVAYEKVQEQKLQAAGNRATAAEVKASNDKTVKAKAESKAAKAETAVAKGKEKAAKTQQRTTKKQTQSRVAATPTVSSKETVGDGITKTSGIDKNGKPFVQYHEGKKRLSNAEAEARIAGASGAAAKPGSRFKSMFSGKTGKVGAAGLIASILGGTVGGPGGDFLSTAGNAAIVASTIKSFMPEGAGANFRQGAIGKRVAPLIDNVALKFAELTPKLIKFGKFFGGPLTLAATAAMMIYDAATADLRKRAEINTAIYNTLNTTQAKLEKINEFFGTTAKMSQARTMQMIPVGFNNKKAFSAADEFRKSEQFKAEYQASAQTLSGATNEEFKIAMESLAFDLVASGVGEEQTQAIIDAIKMEAKKTDVVIEVKSLALDTESGFNAAKENIKASLGVFSKEIEDYFNLGGYSISEVMEGRNKGWLESFFGGFTGFNTDVLINQIKQVANTLNGVSAAYLSAAITGKQFDDQLESLADGIAGLKPADQIEAYDAILTDLNPTIAELANGLNDSASYGLILKSVLAGITFSPEVIELLKQGSFDIVNAAYKKAKAAQDEQLAQKKALQKQQANLQKQQKEIQNNEDAINKKYDDRIRALERIDALNQKISQQQKNQLDLADALSQGDVFAAAQAVQQMRADDAAYALEQQKNVLEDQRRKELDAQGKASGNIEKQQAAIQEQIANISDAVINIDKYIVYPPRTEDRYKGGQGLQDILAREELKKAGFKDKQLDFFFGEGKTGNYNGPFGVNGIPSEADFNRMKQAYANYQIYGENSETGTLNAAGVRATAQDISKSGMKKTGWWDWRSKTDPSKNTVDTLPYQGLYMNGQTVAETLGSDKIKRGLIIKDPSGKVYQITDLLSTSQNAQYPSVVLVEPQKKAAGGYISGPGSGTSDSIPARLSNGEYVIRAKAVEALGTDVLDKMNHAEKFAKGGLVQRFSEGGSPDAIDRRAADKNKNKGRVISGSSITASLIREVNSKLSNQGANPLKTERSNIYSMFDKVAVSRYISLIPKLIEKYPHLAAGLDLSTSASREAFVRSLTVGTTTPGPNKVSDISKTEKAMNMLYLEKYHGWKPGDNIRLYRNSTNKASANLGYASTDPRMAFGYNITSGINRKDAGAGVGRSFVDISPTQVRGLVGASGGQTMNDEFAVTLGQFTNRVAAKTRSASLKDFAMPGDKAFAEHGMRSRFFSQNQTHNFSRMKTQPFGGNYSFENILTTLGIDRQKYKERYLAVNNLTPGSKVYAPNWSNFSPFSIDEKTKKWTVNRVPNQHYDHLATMQSFLPKSERYMFERGNPARIKPSSGGSYGSSMPTYGWSGTNQKFAVGKANGGIIGKGPKKSSDSGLDWFNQFIQNLLGGGNPSGFMQSDTTKSLVANSYVQGAKNMGVDPTDPMFYASMFAPSMGIKALGMAGKGVSKLKGLSTAKDTGTRTTLPNYIDNPRVSQAYLNFMRTNPAISVRMRSEQLIDKLAKKDFAYRNAFEEGMVVDDLDPRLEAERILFGLGKDAAPSSRPIYGAGVSPYTPWSIRGKASRNDNAFERWALRSKSSNINSEYFDRYGDISLLLKNRVKKRSTFTLGDSFSARERDSYIPGGPKKTVPAPFGTMSQSKILGAATGMNRPDLKFVEAQIFGGLPFSDIKKIIVKNPEMIPLLQQKLAEAGLKIPVGQTKLSPLGKLNEMFYKNKVHGPTGLPMFIPQYKSGGMFRTPYANGGLAMLHDKEFVMNPGAVKEYGVDKLKAMNNGTYNSGSVYNSYGVNINVNGSNSDANEIARTVIKEIKKIDAQQIRSTKV